MFSSFDYVGQKSTQIEKNINKMTEKVYRTVKPRVIFTSSSILIPKEKTLYLTKTKVAWFTRLNAVAQTVKQARLPGIWELAKGPCPKMFNRAY